MSSSGEFLGKHSVGIWRKALNWNLGDPGGPLAVSPSPLAPSGTRRSAPERELTSVCFSLGQTWTRTFKQNIFCCLMSWKEQNKNKSKKTSRKGEFSVAIQKGITRLGSWGPTRTEIPIPNPELLVGCDLGGFQGFPLSFPRSLGGNKIPTQCTSACECGWVWACLHGGNPFSFCYPKLPLFHFYTQYVFTCSLGGCPISKSSLCAPAGEQT